MVQEPPQPKIRLKMTPGQETPVIGPKKITIHVGGSRGSTTASPAPQTNQSADSGRPDGVLDGNRNTPLPAAITTGASFEVDNSRALPGVVASPRPGAVSPMPGVAVQQPPAAFAIPNGNMPGVANAPNGMSTAGPNLQQPLPAHQLQNGYPHPAPAPAPAPLIHDHKYRAPGRGRSMMEAFGRLALTNMCATLTLPPGYADALLPSVLIRTHPSVVMDHRFRLEIPAHPKEAQQNLTLHIPGHHSRLQIVPRLAPFEQQGRAYRLFVTVNGQMVGRTAPLPVADDPLPPNAMVFDASLQYATNIIAITAVASLPKGQKLPNGADCEVEKLTLNVQLLRVYQTPGR